MKSKLRVLIHAEVVFGPLLAIAVTVQPLNADTAGALKKRLQEGDLSLEGVAKKHVEVEMNDLLGLARPMTQRMPIQAQYHPDPVAAHPELSITLGSRTNDYVIGFALGTPARLPGLTEAVHTLHVDAWKRGNVR